jgi:hypothetical protein
MPSKRSPSFGDWRQKVPRGIDGNYHALGQLTAKYRLRMGLERGGQLRCLLHWRSIHCAGDFTRRSP